MAPNAFSAFLWIFAAVAAALAVYAWGRRPHPSAASLSLTMGCIAVWLFAYGCELASTSRADMLFWLRVEYPGIALLPAAYLLFAYRYAGSRFSLSRPAAAVLLVLPAITVVSVWTNDSHGLYYARATAIESFGLQQLELIPGPLYWLNLVYAYACLLLGAVILFRAARSISPRLRGAAQLLLIGGLAPFAAAVARAVGLRPFGVMDITALSLPITTVCTLILVLRHRFLEISPLARDLVVDRLDHGLLVLDPSDQVLDTNPSLAEALGDATPVVGRSAKGLLERWPDLRDLCKAEHPASKDVVVTADSNPRTFEVHMSPVTDAAGEIVARALVWRDVTEARRAVEALKTQERVLRAQADATYALLESSNPDDGVMQALAAVGRVLEVHRAYVFEDHIDPETGAVCTSQRYEWVADGIRAYIDDKMLQNVHYMPDFARWYETLSQGRCIAGLIKQFPEKERAILEDQGIVSLLVVPIVVDRKLWGFLGIDDCRDPREWSDSDASSLTVLAAAIGSAILRGRALEEIRKMNATLNERVAERTMDLENANRELEAFASAVSHDLRAPSRWIEGFSRALDEGYRDILGEEGVRYLDRIRAASIQLDARLDGLLRLSNVGRSEMRVVRVSISEIASEIVDELQQRHPDRAVHVHIEPNLWAHACPKLLRIALGDLIENAWKFTAPKPDARIGVGSASVRRGTSERPITAFYVRDNGVGYDPAYAHKLFGAFQRLHSESEFPGTGMGLAVVQRIIHRHGGEVWAEGALGEGATFYFTLPESDAGVETDGEIL
ncbi:MAG: GAF domain-containing protein [Chthonomonadales bacterium]|nr:GAF domain-containing protein [Chthonomonadales bacterium]